MRFHKLRDERGFTLPEMMVTIMIMIVVLFSLYGIFDMSIRVFRFGNDKVEAVENARLGLERMERELRAAYPVDRDNGKNYVLLNPADPTQKATTLYSNQITFGNDLDGNGKLTCLSTTTCEFITYKLNTGSPYTLYRVNTATPSTSIGDPMVQFVNGTGGLEFTYLRPDPAGNLVTTTSVDDVKVVRVKLQIVQNGTTHTLTTDINLRNRGF